MKKDIQLLIEKLKHKYKQKQIWKGIACILSLIATFITVKSLVTPAVTLNEEQSYTLSLRDSYVYDWKDSTYKTSYDLDLYFMDTTGRYIEGKDVTFEIKADGYGDHPYGFGVVPYADDSLKAHRGSDLISILGLTTYISSTGEKYEFDHAEVLVGDTWYTFSATGRRWHIWCQNASWSSTDSSLKPADYGWRGRYGENATDYTINENTKYKFVYKEVRYGVKDSVETLGTDSGITFKMFNYSGDNSQSGNDNINNNGVYNFFTFRGVPGTNNATAKINTTIDADAFIDSTRIKVKPLLDSSKNPTFDCRNYSGCNDFSLGYLFGSTTNPAGTTTKGVTSYTPINTLLQKDNNGNYYYDSIDNAVDFDTTNQRFMVRNYKERSLTMTSTDYDEYESNRYEFMPFNYWGSFKTLKTNPDSKLTYNYENSETESIDHWFGMTMEFNFYMPKDGYLNGEEMIFSFSGDDDVWVFIDDVLVLDLGGTHGVVEGTINFATGAVESYLNWAGTNAKEEAVKAGVTKTETYNLTNIYKMYENASSLNKTEWEGNTYKDYSHHTLKFFYLERGASVSNCKIKFNMPVLPPGSLSVQKQFSGTNNYAEDNYVFTLYGTTGENTVPVVGAKYTIDGEECQDCKTNENGEFILSNNQTAVFLLNNFHKYYVKETNTGNHAQSYSCTLNGTTCTIVKDGIEEISIDQTNEFEIMPDSAYRAVFTNENKKFDLTIDKVVEMGQSDEEFQFKLTLKDKDNQPVNIETGNNSQYSVENGIVTFNLKNGKNITINNIPIDTSVTLEEITHDGYHVLIKSEDVLLANGNTYEFNMDSDKFITVHNTPGVILPETGGSGILWYLLIGISLITISIKFAYKYIFNMKEGEV